MVPFGCLESERKRETEGERQKEKERERERERDVGIIQTMYFSRAPSRRSLRREDRVQVEPRNDVEVIDDVGAIARRLVFLRDLK